LPKKKGMLRIDIITVLPELIESPLNHSILKRAKAKGLAEIHIHNLRDFSEDKHKRVDDYAFSGDAGMVMRIEPIDKAISFLKSQRNYDEVIYTSPDGEILNQKMANRLSTYENLIILCGHYKGVDQRVREHLITMEISIGDYVLTGGELPALILIDAIARLLPDVLGDPTGAEDDSHSMGLLEYPHYTKPAEFRGWKVPEVLQSGNHAMIDKWRREQSLLRTLNKRPDMLEKAELSDEDRKLAASLSSKVESRKQDV